MYKNIYKLLGETLPLALVFALAAGAVIGIFYGHSFLEPFILGVAISILNFILLSLSMHIITNFTTYKARNIYTILFFIRYAIIFFVIYNDALIDLKNVIFIFIGFSMLLFSIKLNAFYKHFTYRKESKNGGSQSRI